MIKQLAKLHTDDPSLNRVQEHLLGQLNPVLKNLPQTASFRLQEAAGTNGAAPTFQLQYTADTSGNWTTVLTVDSSGRISQPAWQTPTLTNSWVNYGGAFQTAQYMKDSLGFVRLRGTVKSGTGSIFTLPVGYRPMATLNIVVDASGAFGELNITSAGFVLLTVGSNGYVSLDGITFLAEQ